uniref:Uncharacterized protein n=1 Tax=Ditylenchus dipsaci TaxID=166011 RepID=A0A915EHV9_9BILA
MGQSIGKSQSCTKKPYYSYGLPPRRKTVPNENGNHFMKEYWAEIEVVQLVAVEQIRIAPNSGWWSRKSSTEKKYFTKILRTSIDSPHLPIGEDPPNLTALSTLRLI